MKYPIIWLIIVTSIVCGDGRHGKESSGPSTTFAPIDFEKARDEITANMKRNYNELKDATKEFRTFIANESKPLQDWYQQMTEKVVWYFREPSDEETAQLDKVLNTFLPFGAEDSDYIDTNEKMEVFCKDHDKQLDTLNSWLRRQYKSFLVQMAFNMLITKIDKQTDHYCESAANKQEYVTHLQKLKTANSKIIPAKADVLDAAEFVKNSTYKLSKIGRLCCTYWDYLKAIKESVQDPKAGEFAMNMLNGYFSSATNYLCVLYPQGQSICKEEEKSPKSQPKFKSLILQLVFTLSDIVGSNPKASQ